MVWGITANHLLAVGLVLDIVGVILLVVPDFPVVVQ